MALAPLSAAFGVILLLTLARLSGTVDSDVAWQLWIGGRIQAGADLYTDIIETNPPLWFWMAVPVDRLTGLLHIRVEAALVGVLGLLVALALSATDRLIGYVAPKRRALLLCYAALALLGAPWMHAGQREQIALIATLPYASLVAARRRGDPVPVWLAASVGIGAGLGFALKHYFLLVPLVLEVWLAAAPRRHRLLRPETLAIATVGIAYAAALMTFDPDFVTRIVPLLQLAYGAMGAPSIAYMLGPFAVVGLVTLGLVATQPRPLASAPLASALALAAFAYAAAYFIQFKGWIYHNIPLIGCSSLALAALLIETKPSRLIRFVAPALLALPLMLATLEQLNTADRDPDLLAAVDGLKSGDSVGFLAYETAVPWSVTLQGGYRYASRYNGFWMMRAIVRNELLGHPDPRLDALGRQIVSETVLDFTCAPPRRIIVVRPLNNDRSTFDILPFFLRDPRFAALLSHYRVRSRTSFETYELTSPLPAPAAACRRGV